MLFKAELRGKGNNNAAHTYTPEQGGEEEGMGRKVREKGYVEEGAGRLSDSVLERNEAHWSVA